MQFAQARATDIALQRCGDGHVTAA